MHHPRHKRTPRCMGPPAHTRNSISRLCCVRSISFRRNGRVQDRRRRGREHRCASRKTLSSSKSLKQCCGAVPAVSPVKITVSPMEETVSISHRQEAQVLATWHVKLQEVLPNVHGIDSITPDHVVTQVALTVLHAKTFGPKLCIQHPHLHWETQKRLTLQPMMASSIREIQNSLSETASLCHVLITQPQAVADDLVTGHQRLNRSADAERRHTEIATVYIPQVHVTNSLRRLCCLRHVLGILDRLSFVHPSTR